MFIATAFMEEVGYKLRHRGEPCLAIDCRIREKLVCANERDPYAKFFMLGAG